MNRRITKKKMKQQEFFNELKEALQEAIDIKNDKLPKKTWEEFKEELNKEKNNEFFRTFK